MSNDKKKKVDQITEMKAVVSNHMVITVDGTDDRKFTFSMPFHTPLQECYNAAVNAANEIARMFSEAVEKQKEAKAKKEAGKKAK